MRSRTVAGLILLGILAAAAIIIYQVMSRVQSPSQYIPPPPEVGAVIDSYQDVMVYNNGPEFATSYGRHFSDSGYYFGQKWQCVEFIKRFYYQSKGHEMPDVMGHAKDFFDPNLASGNLNLRRGLIQYTNGSNEAPQAGDLLVWNRGTYGHVAIISQVTHNDVEIVQQNIAGFPRDHLPLQHLFNNWIIGGQIQPAGWLRLPLVPIDRTRLAPPDPLTPQPGDP